MNEMDRLFPVGATTMGNFNPMATGAICLCISRTVPWNMKSWKHIMALAPSADLVFKFWKNSTQDYEAWDEYTRRWDLEKADDEEYWKMIRLIATRLKEGKTVYIGCYCKDVVFCHRWLVERDVESVL
jgi:protein-tyrosine phosphatase